MASVLDYLLGRGLPFLVLPAPDVVSVADTIAAHGVNEGDVVRTEVMIGLMGPALMVVPGSRYLDLELAQVALQDPGARFATHAEIRSLAPDCEIGAVPPLSLFLLAPMFVDPAVAEMSKVVFPAGRNNVLIRMEREDLFRDDPYVVVALTRESYVPEPLLAPSRRQVLADDEDLLPVHLSEQPSDRPADVA
ncbi:MAG TPA: YbaK/EbsC family protein [Actinomycetota bacterium]